MSARRLAEFLRCPEQAPPQQLGASEPGTAAPAAIRIAGSFGWGGSGGDSKALASTSGSADAAGERTGPVLQGLELSIPAGTLVALTGPVGSGKSSLLSAILGELLPAGEDSNQSVGAAPAEPGLPPERQPLLHRKPGRPLPAAVARSCVAAGSRVAFVPQEPWIMHGSLR